MRTSPAQESFAAGEISRRVRGRVSSDVYKQGLARALNWYPLVQGPIRMREGTKYIIPVDSGNWTAGNTSSAGIRTFTFQRGIDEDKVVEIGETSIAIRDSENGEPVVDGETGQLIPNNKYSGGLGSEWTFDNQKYQFNGSGTATLIGPYNEGSDGAYFQNVMQLHDGTPDYTAAGAIESASGSPVVLPSGAELQTQDLTIRTKLSHSSPYVMGELNVRVLVGTSPGASDVLNSTYAVQSGWQEELLNFVPGAGNNTLYLSVGVEWGPGDIPSSLDNEIVPFLQGVHTWTAPTGGGSGTPVTFTSPWTASQLECLHMAMDPGERVMVFTHPDVEPHFLTLSDGGLWEFTALSAMAGFVAPSPNPWAAGNYPATCSFHEGRLVLGGAPNDPGTLWGSRSGDYVDFNASAATDKADPYLFPLSTSGNIQSLTSRKDLVINTDISEVIGFADVGPIAFDDFDFPKQSDWGTNCVQPVVVGSKMLFTSNSRRKVRIFEDQGDQSDGYDGDELTLLASDIFSSPIRRMVYLDEPSYQAVFLLADGTLGCATYYYQQNVIGWWRMEIAYNGSAVQSTNRVMDICKINTSQGAKLWMVVNRVGFSGTTVPVHELLSFDTGRRFALDSWASRNVDGSAGTCSDLDHLTGQTVHVIIERSDPDTGDLSYTVHPEVTVTAGVTDVLQNWAWGNTAYIGLAYENEIQLLPIEGVSNRGTSQVSKRRWVKAVMRMNDSAVPLVDGQRPRSRTPSSSMGEGEPFTSEDVEFTDLGSGKGNLTITQDIPLISEISAIFGKVSSKEI